MVYRPVDENGDMIPIMSIGDTVTGVEAVSQVIRSRIHLLYGEWWENEELGFAVPEFIFDGARNNALGVLSNYINEYILESEGVTNANTTAKMDGRTAVVECTIETEYGLLEEEVSQSELLRAVY